MLEDYSIRSLTVLAFTALQRLPGGLLKNRPAVDIGQ
jgi:hypothetical protein